MRFIDNTILAVASMIAFFVFVVILFVSIYGLLDSFDTYYEDKDEAESISYKLTSWYRKIIQSGTKENVILDSLYQKNDIVDKNDLILFSRDCISFWHEDRIYTIYVKFDKRFKREKIYYEDVDEMLERLIVDVIHEYKEFKNENGRKPNNVNELNLKDKMFEVVKVNLHNEGIVELDFEGDNFKRKIAQ